MNEMLEFWRPWQALQRRLADGFSAEAERRTAAGSMSFDPRAITSDLSWLARARGQLGPAVSPASRVSG